MPPIYRERLHFCLRTTIASRASFRLGAVLVYSATWLNLDTPLDAAVPLGPDQFTVRPVNRAVNKVSEKSLEAIERA